MDGLKMSRPHTFWPTSYSKIPHPKGFPAFQSKTESQEARLHTNASVEPNFTLKLRWDSWHTVVSHEVHLSVCYRRFA